MRSVLSRYASTCRALHIYFRYLTKFFHRVLTWLVRRMKKVVYSLASLGPRAAFVFAITLTLFGMTKSADNVRVGSDGFQTGVRKEICLPIGLLRRQFHN